MFSKRIGLYQAHFKEIKLERKPFPKSFVAELDNGTRVEFYQYSHPEGVIPPSFILEVRGPGQEGQDEFVGRIKVEVCAHGHLEQFRRFLTLTSEHAKPLELEKQGYSCKVRGASFYPPERVSYEVIMGTGDAQCSLKLPAHAFHTIRLEMLQTKPPGDIDI